MALKSPQQLPILETQLQQLGDPLLASTWQHWEGKIAGRNRNRLRECLSALPPIVQK